MRLLIRFRSIPALFLLITCAVTLHAQQKFGYVLDVRGDWTANGAKLSKGSSLNVGSTIQASNPSDGSSYIVVADRNGNVVEKRTCGAGECNKAIQLPNSIGQERSIISRVLSAAMALVSNEPAKYASLVSRGADLREAVVKLNNDQLDLQDVFQNMKRDRYLVHFEPLGKNSGNAATKPLPFDWDPQKPSPLSAHGLAPGLYRVSISEVSLLEPEAGGEPSGNEAWVLVATPKNYGKAAPMFADAQQMTKRWGSDVKQSVTRSMLRASLDAITNQTSQ